MQRLAAQLIGYRFNDFGIAVADVEDAESAQAVEVDASGYVAIGVRSGIRPLDDRAGAARVGRLAIFEESRIDVIAK